MLTAHVAEFRFGIPHEVGRLESAAILFHLWQCAACFQKTADITGTYRQRFRVFL